MLDLSIIMRKARENSLRLSKAVGIEWAPLNIPRKRRIQTLAATGWICLILFGEAFTIYLTIKALYTDLWWFVILYCVWMLHDIDICENGGRRFEWVRNWPWWRYYCQYFPIKLIKTVDLDPERNYLFACFPHGVVSSGAFGAFATNALNFYEKFPGMTCHLITLKGHFLIPFFRELILGLGGCSSSKQSLVHLLDKKRYKGKCVALIVGGAAEALDAHPGEYKVILSRRKGFIRVAMETGAPLVPVVCFGEVDVFRPPNNPNDSWLRRFQENVRKYTGISPMFPIGRGMFQYTFGFVPLRSPVYVVVGAPMEVNKNLEPTDDEVNALHAEFTKCLIDLFETEKYKYLKNPKDVSLVIT